MPPPDALANATSRLNAEQKAAFAAFEAQLLTRAAKLSVETFQRECNELVRSILADDTGDGRSELERQRERNQIRTWIDRATGMGHLRAELDPESFAR
jgi:hypothetical protein